MWPKNKKFGPAIGAGFISLLAIFGFGRRSAGRRREAKRLGRSAEGRIEANLQRQRDSVKSAERIEGLSTDAAGTAGDLSAGIDRAEEASNRIKSTIGNLLAGDKKAE